MKLSFPLRGIGTNPGIYCTQWFGENPEVYAKLGMKGHNGIDWGCPIGTPVYAAHDGQAVYGMDPGGFGHYVKIQGSEVMTVYGHLSKFEGADRQVKEGDLIAYSGNEGFSTGPHLHFGVRPNVANQNDGYYGYIDPKPLMKILIRFVGWKDFEKGIYLPFDTMNRMDEIFASLPALKDYQFEEHEFNLGKRPFPDPFAKA